MTDRCKYRIPAPTVHKGRIRLYDDKRCKRSATTHGYCWQHWTMLPAYKVEQILRGSEATHTNYNTGEPCFCDEPFDYQPGPCIDEEPVTTGDDPRNGTG